MSGAIDGGLTGFAVALLGFILMALWNIRADVQAMREMARQALEIQRQLLTIAGHGEPTEMLERLREARRYRIGG